jgi:hypothetical protein
LSSGVKYFQERDQLEGRPINENNEVNNYGGVTSPAQQ